MSEVGVMAAPAAADQIDTTRRKFLTFATAGLAAVGAVATAVPFVESWNPSERARALGAPVEVDLSKMEVGQLITATWRRQVIYIVRRPQSLVDALAKNNAELKDPDSKDSNQPAYAQNEMRSRTAEFLVMIGYCTHLGCLPKAFFDPGDPVLGPTWPGGFRCPCHGSRYDMAGRVFDGAPAPYNLVVPPYSYRTPTTLVVGLDNAAAAAGNA
ncbi:MAG TPA: ubiquinol-cytochrome c reductase iron-sulfur subunit [Steroidobacteraceae bacterium]|nr:ubiquinol-cytochrome c reductase iron-sulfur subunit [Steroidobacteraceae bacterium]